MIKEIPIYFKDDFVPPDNFEPATYENRWTTKCNGCPFHVWNDELTPPNDCIYFDPTDEDENVERCPLKKYFK